ncbi:hypothetical protein AHiyo1_02100 [Arthrobacter sp. Hiyo1]|nr:hypothetical protein AHiyo1_02100 [Arthrobacter sp. Hiyo1]
MQGRGLQTRGGRCLVCAAGVVTPWRPSASAENEKPPESRGFRGFYLVAVGRLDLPTSRLAGGRFHQFPLDLESPVIPPSTRPLSSAAPSSTFIGFRRFRWVNVGSRTARVAGALWIELEHVPHRDRRSIAARSHGTPRLCQETPVPTGIGV